MKYLIKKVKDNLMSNLNYIMNYLVDLKRRPSLIIYLMEKLNKKIVNRIV